MAIHEPGRRLMHHVGLQFVEKAVGGGGGRATNANLSLTSMIDFLVVTVVFLLISFNASGETRVYKGLELPKAQNAIDMAEAPIIAISAREIAVDGATLGASTSAISELEGPARTIPELQRNLDAKKKTWMDINGGNKNKSFPGVVILQIDGKVPAKVVKAVFQTCGISGYANVSFMVNRLAGGPH
jgi:biopolymer transport protein ExbD